jgi:hypothetical protein
VRQMPEKHRNTCVMIHELDMGASRCI